MTKLTRITYRCDLCNNEYKTSQKAHACERTCAKLRIRATETEVINNEVRLSLENPADIWDAIKDFALRYYEWEIEYTEAEKFDFVNIEQVYTSHGCPIGKPNQPPGVKAGSWTYLYYSGWKFWVKGTITGSKYISDQAKKEKWNKREEEPGFSKLFGYGSRLPYKILGCHTGTFNGGENFSGEFYMFVDDFPKIKVKYDKHESEKEQNKQDSEMLAKLTNKSW